MKVSFKVSLYHPQDLPHSGNPPSGGVIESRLINPSAYGFRHATDIARLIDRYGELSPFTNIFPERKAGFTMARYWGVSVLYSSGRVRFEKAGK